MTIIDVMLVFSVTLNIILFILAFMMFITVNNMNVHITQMYNAMSSLIPKITHQENLIRQIGHTLADFMDQMGIGIDQISMALTNIGGGKMGQLFKTMDGKYTAGSLEELMDKIKKDDKEDEYFNDDMDDLRKLFETGEDDVEDDEEEGT